MILKWKNEKFKERQREKEEKLSIDIESNREKQDDKTSNDNIAGNGRA